MNFSWIFKYQVHLASVRPCTAYQILYTINLSAPLENFVGRCVLPPPKYHCKSIVRQPQSEDILFLRGGGGRVGVRSNPVFWINIYKCIWPAHLNNVPGFYNLYYRVVLSSIFCFCEVCQLEYSVHGYILIISNIIHCWYLFYISFIYFSVFVYVQCTLVLSV